jgi:hypothetical protein
MVQSELIKNGKQVGVRFSNGTRTWEVLFGTEGGASGHIAIREDGKILMNRALTTAIMPQKGLFGTE